MDLTFFSFVFSLTNSFTAQNSVIKSGNEKQTQTNSCNGDNLTIKNCVISIQRTIISGAL